jgi:hypothetical protein
MPGQPAVGDRALDARAVFIRAAAGLQKWQVDQVLAISMRLRAATSGFENGRSVTSFIWQPR